jgi:alkylation response protein AidB-like acyl-CoA dehydrogenase
MYFDLSGKQREIKRAAFEFAKREFDKDLALELERRHVFPEQIHKKACQLGFIGVHYPEPYGGQGYGILENSLVVGRVLPRAFWHWGWLEIPRYLTGKNR